MTVYRLLPGALKNIAVIMDSLGIKPVDPGHAPGWAVKVRARFYMTPVHWKNQVVWFKARLQDAPGLERGLVDEITIQRAFADYERGRTMSFDSPSFLAAGRRGSITWLLRRYWTGWYAGDMTESFGFSRRFVQAVPASRFATVVHDVRRMTPFMRRRLRLATHDAGWYLLDWHFYRRHFLRPVLAHQLNPGWTNQTVRTVERVLKESAGWMRKNATWFTHGDFYPNNLMVTGKKHQQIVLFDWELSHLNLPTFDAVMAWLMAWRYTTWQKQFYRLSLKRLPVNQDTARAWALASLSLGLRLAGFAFIRLTNSQPDRYPRLPARHRPTIQRMYQHMVRVLNKAMTALAGPL